MAESVRSEGGSPNADSRKGADVDGHSKGHVVARDAQQVQSNPQPPTDSERKQPQSAKPRQQKDERGFVANSGRREVFTVRVSQTGQRRDGGKRQRQKQSVEALGNAGGEGEGEEEGVNKKHEARRERDGGRRQQSGRVVKERGESEQQKGSVEPVRRGKGEGEGKREGVNKKQEMCDIQTKQQRKSPSEHTGIDPRRRKEWRRRQEKERIVVVSDSLQHSDNTRPEKPRNRDKREQQTVGVQQRSKVGSDAERKAMQDGMQSESTGSGQRRKQKPQRNRNRSDARNWREKSAEEDTENGREIANTALPAGAIVKHELGNSEKPSREKGGEEGGDGKRNKKAGHSVPRKTSPKDKQVVPTLQSSELTQQLSTGRYSCMVCCDRVRGKDAVWSCRGCYHVFHLECVRKWAISPVSLLNEKDPAEGWRCPACQNGCLVVPTLYKCYCGKITNPHPISRGDLTAPHSCGDLCGQNLARTPQSSCQHKCQLLCHPGPCPPCPVMVTRSCPCGRHSYQVRCSKTGALPSCGSTCGRKLSCGNHHCTQECHAGSCPKCEVMLTQLCHCGRSQRGVRCGEKEEEKFECTHTCGKELNCGNHLCELLCHPPPCPSCSLLPSRVRSCPCGATPLSILLSSDQSRTSCLDPVPTCDSVCGKRLPCSTHAEPHFCSTQCHEGLCPLCEKSRVVWCRCGKGNTRVDCQEMEGMGEYVCEKPCNKMKSCGRHRCNNRCCLDSAHHCDLICGKRLQCGNHNCNEVCHKGHCDQCWEYSYEELKCHCGGEVLYPPLACGTRPPACSRVCARIHSCDHQVTHSCHNEEECPPCTMLTVKMCMGGHEQRHNIPCHITDVSCGLACGKELPCGNHKCQKTCHRGVCMDSPAQCKQPCQTARKYCSHVCGDPCHVGRECPDTACKAEVVLKCKCGLRKERVVCGASSSGVMQQAFHKILSKDLGAKIRDLQSGQSVSLGRVTLASLGKDKETLECDEVCLQVERNKALAEALGISSAVVNPLEPPLPKYSAYLVEQARNDTALAASIEDELRSFVEMVMKGPAGQVRRHRFSPMFSKERKLIHELAPHYGCESLSYDTEPQRYVTVSTKKSTAKLPSVSLVKMIEREKPKATPTLVNLPSERGSSPEKLAVGASSIKEVVNDSNRAPVTDYFADDL